MISTEKESTWFCEKCPKNQNEDCGPFIEGTQLFQSAKKIHHIHKGWQKGEPKSNSFNEFSKELSKTMEKASQKTKEREKQKGVPIKQIEDYLATQILDDRELVSLLIRVGLSAYTNNPLNLMIKAPTSEGKTHAATNVMKLFPKEDVLFLGGMSPTALIHENGILVSKTNQPIKEELQELQLKLSRTKDQKIKAELEKEAREILSESKNLVELSGKILVFLDTPNWELWKRLKPILSHDMKEIEFKITDKKERGQLHTKNTVIRGWPAVIYCSARNEEIYKEWDEIESRFIITSPNTNASKYKKAIDLIAKQSSYPDFAEEIYHNGEDEKYSIYYISVLKDDILTFKKQKNSCYNPFYKILKDCLPNNEGSTMRIAEKFFAICNLETMINHQYSCKIIHGSKQQYLITTLQDIEKAIDLFGTSNSLPPDKVKFFKNVFEPAITETVDNTVTSSKLAEKYEQVYHKPITPKKILENYLNSLEAVGLIEWRKDPDDARTHLYRKASELTEKKFEYIKSKIIEYSKNNPSFVESGIKELQQYSSEPLTIEDPNRNPITYEILQLKILETTNIGAIVLGTNA